MNNKRRDAAIFGGALLLLFVSLFLSLRFGSTYLTNAAFFGGIFQPSDFKSAAVFIHRGQKKVMRITEIWENFDYLMTFPHLHPNRQTELELIKKRNERLKWEKKLMQIKK